MRIRTNERQIHLKTLVVLVALIGVLAYFFIHAASSTTPANALLQAVELKETNHTLALSLLKITAKDNRLKHWARLLEAQILEKQATPQEAIKNYKLIPSHSAAYLDAKVALLRLLYHPPQSTSFIEATLNPLRTSLEKARRADLIPDLLQTEARAWLDLKDIARAIRSYQAIRLLYPLSPLVASARRETHALLEKNPELIKSLPENFMAEEVSLLLKENQAIIALAKVQEQKIAIAPKTPEYFGTLFLEAQILKALRRGEEADYILLTISADGELGGADRAMLQITKDAWNANDHDRAFQFINRLLERFPQTSYKDEALYIKGHLFEETHQLAEAKHVYLELHDSTVSLEIKLKTLKRIAWLYLQQESYVFAADSFQKMFATAEEMLSTAQKPKFDELENLHHHAMFWQAFALSKLDSATLRKLHHPSAESIWESLSKMQPPTFYSMLAGEFLAGGTAEMRLVSRNSHTESDMRQCMLDLPARLIDTLAELKSVDLSQFAQFEVDWFLANQMDSAKFSELSRTPIVRIQTDTTRASLYSQFANPTLAIRAASRALREVAPLETSDERLSRCADFLLDLSYPTAEIEVFREAASTFSVSESTLLAIARTESHFDPKAISSVGAMGLMQLMRETAKTEGLLAENDLFDPKTNISLGTKHISRLLSTYDGNKIFAIAAYNAGQSAVNRWRARMPNLEPYLWLELIGYPETRNYVKSVLLAEEIYLQKLLRTN